MNNIVVDNVNSTPLINETVAIIVFAVTGVLLLITIVFLIKTMMDDYKGVSARGYPYNRKQYFLSHEEFDFYAALKTAADELGLIILIKVNLAALLEARTGQTFNAWMRARSFIAPKFIDFLLCDSSLIPMLAIELEDGNLNVQPVHDSSILQQNAFRSADFPYLKVRNADHIQLKIEELIAPYLIDDELPEADIDAIIDDMPGDPDETDGEADENGLSEIPAVHDLPPMLDPDITGIPNGLDAYEPEPAIADIE